MANRSVDSDSSSLATGDREHRPHKRSQKNKAFYEAPADKPTSSQIINESKSWLLKSVRTERPFTPRDPRRSLFAERSGSVELDDSSRPTSGYAFDAADLQSRPVSKRLAPLNHVPEFANLEHIDPNYEYDIESSRAAPSHAGVLLPHPPSGSAAATPTRVRQRRHSLTRPSATDARRRSDASQNGASAASQVQVQVAREHLQATNFRSASASSNEETPQRRFSSSSTDASRDSDAVRRVQSGPKERTSPFDDGLPRAHSASTNNQQDASAASRSAGAGRPPAAPNHGRRKEATSAGKVRATRASETSATTPKAADWERCASDALERLEQARAERDVNGLLEQVSALRRVLSDASQLGRQCSMRIGILKTLFAVLETSEPRLQLRTAHLVLALRVSGNNLVNIARLIFRISKDERNDTLFPEEDMLQQLVAIVGQYTTCLAEASKHQPSADLLVYTVGCMRFLAGQSELARELVRLGAFEALATLMSQLLRCSSSQDEARPQLTHASACSVLIQTVGCMRNFLECSESRPFAASDAVHDLCELLQRFAESYELVLGVCRVLSKVSQFGETCKLLLRFRSSVQMPLGSLLVQLLVQHRRQHDLVVRIAFVLGNLATKVSSEQRELDDDCSAVVFESKHQLTDFLSVLRFYVEQESKRKDEQDRGVHEVLVKLVRVLANASLDERTGKMIAESKTCLKLILTLIERTEASCDNEELLLNAISAINNLSYYMISNDVSSLQDRQLVIAQKMLPLMKSEQPELITETVRVFGNLSRERAVRDLLVESKSDRKLLELLDTNDTELIYCTMGVLLNLMNDAEKRRILKHDNGVTRLLRLLESVLPDDWYTASLICKTLWNFTDSLPSSTVATALGGANETKRALEILTAFSNENFVRTRIRQASARPARKADADGDADDDDADTRQASEWQLQVWRSEFCPVAQALAQRISQANLAAATTTTSTTTTTSAARSQPTSHKSK